MESADIRDARLKVIATVNVKGDIFELTLKVSGEITLICDRCLDEMQMPVDTEYSVFVKYGEDYNDDSDNLLVIPESDNFLNIAYILYDTVALTVPIKHVHPLGKCNRQMSAMLKKHRATTDGEDSELEDQLIEEMDSMEDSQPAQETTDPRWDALRKLGTSDNEE